MVYYISSIDKCRNTIYWLQNKHALKMCRAHPSDTSLNTGAIWLPCEVVQSKCGSEMPAYWAKTSDISLMKLERLLSETHNSTKPGWACLDLWCHIMSVLAKYGFPYGFRLAFGWCIGKQTVQFTHTILEIQPITRSSGSKSGDSSMGFQMDPFKPFSFQGLP